MMNFKKYNNATKIVIPNGVQLTSGDYHSSFSDMKNLKTVHLQHNGVTGLWNAYSGCGYLITSNPMCGDKVTDMYNAYKGAVRLTGSPACGPMVDTMVNAYSGCQKLTGSPVCGDSVIRMDSAYYLCRNLTGSPACGPNVRSMEHTYYECWNLTGSPVCGPNVTNMGYAYQDCRNLTGAPVCGPNVINMSFTYNGCYNLAGNAYFYSPKVKNAYNCFYQRNNSRRLNIYTLANSLTNTTLHDGKITGYEGITWTDEGSYQYNAVHNIYIYPVANVVAARAANED